MLTIIDIAKAANVSISTVSLALNNKGKVNPLTRKKILQIAAKLNYVPNKNARSLVTQKTRNICYMEIFSAPRHINSLFFPEILTGIQTEALAKNYGCFFIILDENITSIKDLPTILKENQSDGFIVWGKIENQISDFLSKYPVVSLFQRNSKSQYTSIFPSSAEGTRTAVLYLIENNHSVIGFIGGGAQHNESIERLLGFRLALEQSGIAVNNDLIVQGDFSLASGYQQMKILLSKKTKLTAVFVANDLMCVGVYRAIHEAGLKIPDDISVIGFDNQEWSQYIDPPLTTVDVNRNRMGQLAAEELIYIIHTSKDVKKQITIPAELKIGASCRKI